MSELSAVVVGCGYAGEQHARGFFNASGSYLAAVCDLNEGRAQSLGEKIGVRAYTNLEDALKNERPNIVIVTTDEYHHDGPTIMALEAGAHVFCEKMMAHSLQAGERMLEAALRTGRTLGVNYNYRHVPAYRLIQENIQVGRLRSPRLIVAHTHAYLWHHTLDLLRFFLGDPTSVQAVSVEDEELRKRTYHWSDHERLLYVPSAAASAIFCFASGTVATISASAWVPFPEHWLSFSIYAPEGSVHIDHALPTGLVGAVGPGPLEAELKALAPFTIEDSFQASVQAFVEAVWAGRVPAASGEDGLAVMRMEAAVARAARDRSLVLLGD